jgi:glucosamine 6-phosphate synthetase-like amidotransferase/phosphosugar isomerase protein
MCGITIYKGAPTEISNIWKSMLEIKHRGEDDGFGFVDITNKNIVRSVLKLSEVKENKLEDRKFKKKTMNILRDRLKTIRTNLKVNTEFFALHNRKASFGNVATNNTHPFKMNKGVYYLHNGNVEGISLLKQYLKMECGNSFKSETDSEFLGWYVEQKLASGSSELEIFKMLDDLCVYGFGVLVRIDLLNNDITIFKDTDRTLYAYTTDTSYLLISEPITTLKNYNKCYRLDKGIIKLTNVLNLTKCICADVTEKLNFAISKESCDYSCDNCKSKAKTKRLWDNKDYCLVCATGDKDLKELEKLKEKINKLNTTTTTLTASNNHDIEREFEDSELGLCGKFTDAGNPIYNWNDYARLK